VGKSDIITLASFDFQPIRHIGDFKVVVIFLSLVAFWKAIIVLSLLIIL